MMIVKDSKLFIFSIIAKKKFICLISIVAVEQSFNFEDNILDER